MIAVVVSRSVIVTTVDCAKTVTGSPIYGVQWMKSNRSIGDECSTISIGTYHSWSPMPHLNPIPPPKCILFGWPKRVIGFPLADRAKPHIERYREIVDELSISTTSFYTNADVVHWQDCAPITDSKALSLLQHMTETQFQTASPHIWQWGSTYYGTI